MSSSTAPSVGRVALLLGLLVSLTIIGSSAVAVALPEVARELDLDTAGTAWVLAAFSLAFSVATTVFGRMADLRGLRRPLRIGVALFVAGSALAAAAPSFAVLIAARLVQGAGAGAVPVLSVGVLAARYEGAARGRALGALTAVVSIVSGSGPLIGGAITQWLGWRAVVAVPVLGALIVEPVARIAPAPSRTEGRVDWHGAALVATVTTGTVVLLQSPATGAGGAVVAVAVALLVGGALALRRHVLAEPYGFLPRRVVTNPALVLSAVSALTLLAAYLGMMLALPLLFSAEQGWSPLRIGVALLPAALVGAVVSRVVGGTAGRLGRYRVVAGLAVASAAGLLLAALGHDTPPVAVTGLALVVSGFAGGQVALLDGIPQLVDADVRGAALGVFNLVFFTGGAVGSAVVGGLGGAFSLPLALAALALLPASGAAAAVAVGRRTRRAAGAEPAPAAAA